MASSTTPLKYNEGAALPQDAPDWAVSASERLKQRHKQGGVGTAAIPPRGSKRVLLHSCCAPCSGAMVEEMCASELIDEIVVFFYNPNIHPRKEYEIRKRGK
jgi:hypothetical protein